MACNNAALPGPSSVSGSRLMRSSISGGFGHPAILTQRSRFGGGLRWALTRIEYFNNRRSMEKTDAVAALAALAQDNRLDVFRLLVQAGSGGMAAGAIAEALDLPPNTLTFHFDRLRMAGLATVRREGRSMIYAAQFETMNALLGFLTENCCGGAPCTPAAACKPARKRTKVPA
jgi:ArsR family transcriptional regulator